MTSQSRIYLVSNLLKGYIFLPETDTDKVEEHRASTRLLASQAQQAVLQGSSSP